ncbi:toxin-antitoxin system YwqK family antitoxin [Flavobacterium sp. 7A]|uniref:toxin-antitoxin system YwqK family antitoxin n=1 Tax=Flavobacterium sp. 7A TaxID=2940571 RepID=UPI0022275C4A|nr:membrane-binding protein [Flavobacterium sp. 7A]MCW2120988.1 antitoxin component YwqK of YwqJK toxin-antitoxin module [Flavobacterium sp. 7A]
MKKYILLTLLLISGMVFSQGIKPKLEVVGKQVKATYYHDNGKVMQEGFFKNGQLQGEWISYDLDGNKTATATYDKGQKVGKWFYWNSKSLNEVDYASNKVTSVRNWKRDPIVNED